MSSEIGAIQSRLGEAVQAYQSSVDDYDREIARLLGVNSTDLRCLEILLSTEEEAAPSLLAIRLGLTTGSVTTMLDRLEGLGYVTRGPHPTDRRKTIVRATEHAAERVISLMTPFLEDSKTVLAQYSPAQLELVTDFLTVNRVNQENHIQRLRELTS